MTRTFALLSGAVAGLTAVGLGAFGSHALRDMLTQSGRLEVYQLAVQYQFYHGLALLATGLLFTGATARSRLLSWAAGCFAGGILFFSGSLYLLALSDKGAWGAVTPVGGVLFIAGWLLLLLDVWKNKKGAP